MRPCPTAPASHQNTSCAQALASNHTRTLLRSLGSLAPQKRCQFKLAFEPILTDSLIGKKCTHEIGFCSLDTFV